MTRSQLLERLKCESKLKTTEEEGVEACSLTCNTLEGVEGCVGASGWDQEELTSFNYSHKLAQHQHKVVSAQLEHLWCQEETHVTQIHKTHHGPDLGKTPPSPLQYIMQLSMVATSKWLFVPRFPSGSLEIFVARIPTTLGAHNFTCRPSITMRSQAKLYPLLRAFQRYVAR